MKLGNSVRPQLDRDCWRIFHKVSNTYTYIMKQVDIWYEVDASLNIFIEL